MSRRLPLVIILLVLCATAAFAASPQAGSGCVMPPALKKALKVGQERGPGQSPAAWAEAREKQLHSLDAKYPGQLLLAREIYYFYQWDQKEHWPAVRERWINDAASRPSDPFLLTRAALAQTGRDTDAAIAKLKQARQASPTYPWAALQLANILSAGKRADLPEAKHQLEGFYTACPASTDSIALWVLPKAGGPELTRKLARALRADLDVSSDPDRLKDYPTLWGLEFRSRPVTDHDAVRQQLTKDLRRLETINKKPDAGWLLLLRDGAKQANATKEAQRAYENRVLEEFPASAEAWRIEIARWTEANPEPKDHANTDAWQTYWRARAQFYQAQASRHPTVTYLASNSYYYHLQDRSLSEADGVALVEAQLRDGVQSNPDNYGAPYSAANTLVERKWQPARALELSLKALELAKKEDAAEETSDNLSDAELADRKKYEGYATTSCRSLVLKAALFASRPDAVSSFAAAVDGPLPDNKDRRVGYWSDRARLARLQKRPADALAYYQAALRARTSPVRPFQGYVDDPLTDEARAQWNELGGTDAAWATWMAAPANAAAVSDEGRWTDATKALPPFELKDLVGKTWTLKGLQGKSVLINLWATWCGPCMNEMPHFQKLYDMTKDRSDIQVLSFNVDEDLGLVAPFVKEKGFTFPVIPAYDLVMSLRDSGFGIPQNWLVDPTGKWRSLQLGFNPSETDWESMVLTKLEGMKR
jgi:thiol-disulfide isomerase/thioredoxin